MPEHGVGTFQAEDEIAAICAAIGASYGGMIGVTSSSGPGIALKTEAMGLAISAELPLVIVNSQRGGPSTGLPTKTEQSDLYQAVYGRNADTPIPVIAAQSPGDCFDTAIEAVRIAIRHMTPVILLTDGYLSNAAEPWLIPNMDDYEPIRTNPAPAVSATHEAQSQVFERDSETLGRPWVSPGMRGLMHRLGGLEKDLHSGHISYAPDNHQAMTEMRAAKIASVAAFIPPQQIEIGEQQGDLAVVSWGSTYGPVFQAVARAREQGHSISHVHLRHLNPLPANLGDLLAGFGRILIAEMNMGQLATLLRDKLALQSESLCKVSGQPFTISEIHREILRQLPPAEGNAP